MQVRIRITDEERKKLTGLVAIDNDLTAIIDGTSIGASGAT